MVLFSLQVVRYTALFSGVLYGITHRRTLQREANAAKIEHAVHHREHLVAQAKEAWKQQQLAGKSDGSEYLVQSCSSAVGDLALLLRWACAAAA